MRLLKVIVWVFSSALLLAHLGCHDHGFYADFCLHPCSVSWNTLCCANSYLFICSGCPVLLKQGHCIIINWRLFVSCKSLANTKFKWMLKGILIWVKNCLMHIYLYSSTRMFKSLFPGKHDCYNCSKLSALLGLFKCLLQYSHRWEESWLRGGNRAW